MGGPHTGLGEEHEDGGLAEPSCYGLITITASHLDLQSIGGSEETTV